MSKKIEKKIWVLIVDESEMISEKKLAKLESRIDKKAFPLYCAVSDDVIAFPRREVVKWLARNGRKSTIREVLGKALKRK
jgi:hypothetical protein